MLRKLEKLDQKPLDNCQHTVIFQMPKIFINKNHLYFVGVLLQFSPTNC